MSLLRRMGHSIRHRGPDGTAEWADPGCGIGFAHARLAVVELSSAGAQPMASASGSLIIVYNGELYNHMELRRELEETGHAPNWRGHSDTETLLAGFETWGVENTLRRATGMFAFALWNRSKRELVLARDRLGEKPIYYGWQRKGGTAAFLFGSELSALACHPAFEGEIDRDAAALFMRYAYIPAPFSIYRGIAKLDAGSYLILSPGDAEPRITRYWSAAEVVRAGLDQPFQGGESDAVDELERLLCAAVKGQMMSDVPLGAFLSGGIDSSTIVALMQSQSNRPVRTFSIGFHDENFNEAEHAKAVSRHLGTEHTEVYLSPEDALAVIPRLPAIYDEPFADSSQIPTFLVCEMARRDVTVALSGDGGDELFGGYGRYHNAAAFWARLSAIPAPLRPALGRMLKFLPPGAWTALSPLLGRRGLTGNEFSSFGQLVHKGADLCSARSPGDLYVGLGSQWPDPSQIVIGGREPETRLTKGHIEIERSAVESMMAIDLQTYLTDDILVKVDRAAMAVSLETRVPLLDHRVVEFAWSLPPHLKIRPQQNKWLLRQLLYRYVPRKLVERPKKGFNVPLHSWLRGPLRGWAEALLDPRRLSEQGLLQNAPIQEAWKTHLRGEKNLHFPLWNVLMFQSWLEAQNADRRDYEPDMRSALATNHA